MVAFLASAHRSLGLINGDDTQILFVAEALTRWPTICWVMSGRMMSSSGEYGMIFCVEGSLHRYWEAVGYNVARLRAATKPESRAWLQISASPYD